MQTQTLQEILTEHNESIAKDVYEYIKSQTFFIRHADLTLMDNNQKKWPFGFAQMNDPSQTECFRKIESILDLTKEVSDEMRIRKNKEVLKSNKSRKMTGETRAISEAIVELDGKRWYKHEGNMFQPCDKCSEVKGVFWISDDPSESICHDCMRKEPGRELKLMFGGKTGIIDCTKVFWHGVPYGRFSKNAKVACARCLKSGTTWWCKGGVIPNECVDHFCSPCMQSIPGLEKLEHVHDH